MTREELHAEFRRLLAFQLPHIPSVKIDRLVADLSNPAERFGNTRWGEGWDEGFTHGQGEGV